MWFSLTSPQKHVVVAFLMSIHTMFSWRNRVFILSGTMALFAWCCLWFFVRQKDNSMVSFWTYSWNSMSWSLEPKIDREDTPASDFFISAVFSTFCFCSGIVVPLGGVRRPRLSAILDLTVVTGWGLAVLALFCFNEKINNHHIYPRYTTGTWRP